MIGAFGANAAEEGEIIGQGIHGDERDMEQSTVHGIRCASLRIDFSSFASSNPPHFM